MRLASTLLAAALSVVFGQITEKTTSQPLEGVRVELSGPTKTAATSGSDGRYRIKNVKPGRYAVTLSSKDVPPQRFALEIGKEAEHALDLTVCSVTLSYSCGAGF